METKTFKYSKCLLILLYSFYHSKVLFIKNQFSKNPTFKIISEVSNCKKQGGGESFNKLLTTLEKIHKNKLFNHSIKYFLKKFLIIVEGHRYQTYHYSKRQGYFKILHR